MGYLERLFWGTWMECRVCRRRGLHLTLPSVSVHWGALTAVVCTEKVWGSRRRLWDWGSPDQNGASEIARMHVGLPLTQLQEQDKMEIGEKLQIHLRSLVKNECSRNVGVLYIFGSHECRELEYSIAYHFGVHLVEAVAAVVAL